MSRRSLSSAQARRVALAAQGFARRRPEGRRDRRHFSRVLDSLGALQLDYVNVLTPAHFLVVYSRLGGYERSAFERFVYARGEYTEQWAHEASIVPVDAWPLLAHRRSAYRMHDYNPLRRLRNRCAYLDAVLDQVRREGPVTAQDLPQLGGRRRKAGDWHRSLRRWALEYHFGRGALVVADRLTNFQRRYDLPERVLPQCVIATTVDRETAQRELLRRASRSLGVATLQDLADYYRMSPRDAQPRVLELVEEGALTEIDVEGWDKRAYLAVGTRVPRSIPGASLMSPFDPVLWYRPRAERLFGFHYRIEIYVPAEKRRWGYYVLPFRIGDEIVARVDLKADRPSGTLRVLAAYGEPGASRAACCAFLARELRTLADWLELETVGVRRHNALTRRLAKAV